MPNPVLRHPDFSKPLILQTDACGYGLGAVPAQIIDGDEHPIAYASRTLEDRETRHAIVEKEALAIAWGIHHFRHYLLGRHFLVQTDSKPLIALRRIKDQNARLQKLSLRLQGYRFTVEHRPGVKNQNADHLSRYPQKPLKSKGPVQGEAKPTPKVASEEAMVQSICALNLQQPLPKNFGEAATAWRGIKNLQEADTWFGAMIRYLRDETWPEDEKLVKAVLSTHDQFLYENEILYRINNTKIQLCVPPRLQHSIMYQCHDVPSAGHLGMKRSYQRLTSRYYWPTMHKDMEEYIRTCPECNLHKPPPRKHKEPLGYRDLPTGVWETVHMDIWSPGQDTAPTSRGNKMVLAFIDAFSKYVVAVPIPNRTAQTVADVIVNRLLPQEGPPVTIVSDNALEFKSRAQQRVYEMFGITRQLIIPRDPKSNGQIERFFRPFRTILASLSTHSPREWDSYVPHAVFAYNTSVHRTICNTPFFLMKGRDPEVLLHAGVPDPRDTNAPRLPDWMERLSAARHIVRAHLENAQEVNKRNYDKTANPQKYAVGDAVLKALPPPAVTFGPRKLSPRYAGPYRVVHTSGKMAKLRPIAYPRMTDANQIVADFDQLRICDENRFVGPPQGVVVDPAEIDPYLEGEIGEEYAESETEYQEEY